MTTKAMLMLGGGALALWALAKKANAPKLDSIDRFTSAIAASAPSAGTPMQQMKGSGIVDDFSNPSGIGASTSAGYGAPYWQARNPLYTLA